MRQIASLLDKALRAAGIPIIGVSIGTEENRSTWVVQFADATAAQQVQAAQLVAAFAVPQDARYVETRDIMRRMTPAEHVGLERFCLLSTDPRAGEVLKLINTLKCGGTVNASSPEAVAGWAVIKIIGVAIGLWPDAATADARVTAILA